MSRTTYHTIDLLE